MPFTDEEIDAYIAGICEQRDEEQARRADHPAMMRNGRHNHGDQEEEEGVR